MNIDDYIKQPIEIKKELQTFFNPDDKIVIFDIGACEGEDSIRYSNMFPNSKIYSFEPVEENYKKLENNILRYDKKNIFPYKEALSDKVGTANLHVSSGRPKGISSSETWDYGNKSSSLLVPSNEIKKQFNWLEFNRKEQVATNTIKNFANSVGLNTIDFLHIDVQGAELMVLNGAQEMLSNIKIIWMEVEKVELYKQQPLKKSIEKYMKLNNFRKYKDTVNKISGDQLYINKDFAKSIEKGYSKVLSGIYNMLVKKNRAKKYSYAQTGEDLLIKFILDSLKIRKPKYLDIGAYHPKEINNTYLFYKLGCSGVCVEPDPYLIKKFNKVRERDVCLNIGISNKSKQKALFYIMSTKTLNTFSKNEADKYVSFGNQNVEKVLEVPMFTINEIVVKYFPDELNLISIDIEGFDEEVIKSFDFNIKRPEVFCIETIDYTEDNSETKNNSIIEFMCSKNYMVFADTYINTIFVDTKKWKNR
jgi:FkbM family methyltransferase